MSMPMQIVSFSGRRTVGNLPDLLRILAAEYRSQAVNVMASSNSGLQKTLCFNVSDTGTVTLKYDKRDELNA